MAGIMRKGKKLIMFSRGHLQLSLLRCIVHCSFRMRREQCEGEKVFSPRCFDFRLALICMCKSPLSDV